MIWAAIKSAINSTIGTKRFVPLDEIIEMEEYNKYYDFFEMYVSVYGDNGGAILVVPRKKYIENEEYQSGLFSRVVIPNTVEEIKSFAFSYSENLKNIIIPNSVKIIKKGAFAGCNSIGNIVIPKGIISIESEAFIYTNISDVFYKGSEEDWKKINIGVNNENLTGANIHYNSRV